MSFINSKIKHNLQGSRSYDIAVIKVKDAYTFDNFVQPACLSSADINIGKQCKLSGLNSESDLVEAALTKVNNDYCRTWFKNEGIFVFTIHFTKTSP